MVFRGSRALLVLDEPRHPGNRIEILGHDLFVLDRDRVFLLQMAHELEDSCGVDDAPLLERVVVGEGKPSRRVAKEKVIGDEATKFLS